MAPGGGGGDGQSFERQLGCMTGFLQIFDRHQILAGKRPYAAGKRLPIYPAGSTSPSERSESSVSSSFVKEPPPPEGSPEASPEKPSLPILDFKDGTRAFWKLREGPRLSLDSRAVVDAKGKLRPREIRTAVNHSDGAEAADDLERQRRSPSVVARLMGLDALPAAAASGGEKAELRRSASESRVPRDMSLFRFVDPSTFQKLPSPDAYRTTESKASEISKPSGTAARGSLAAAAVAIQRKSYFDAQDFFPEPKRTGSLYGEIERRLRMRGIDEPAKDLETLKQILEALQLKGLLHSKIHPHQDCGGQINSPRCRSSNLVFDQQNAGRNRDSPIVIMKPTAKSPRRPPSPPPSRVSRPVHRKITPDRPAPSRGQILPERRRPQNAGTPPLPQRRSPAVHSPRTSPKRVGPDPLAVRSPRNRRAMPEAPPNHRIHSQPVEYDSISSPSISEGSVSNSSSSQCDFERSRVQEEQRAGRSLLERCDKLLHSIEAITSSSSAAAEQFTAGDQQPSPVSVLDASAFLGGDEISPAVKRSVDFKDQVLGEWEEDNWSQGPPSVRSEHVDGPSIVEDHDLAYVSEILIEWDRSNDPSSDVYAVLEKGHQRTTTSSPAARLHRRLIFDAVTEILERKRSVPAWDAFSQAALLVDGAELLRHVWAELRRVREGVVPAAGGDLNEVTCGAISKDMAAAAAAGERGWGGACATEMSNAVLYIERQIFKDLVAETIRDLTAGKPRNKLPRRKLFF